ncbi:uncharacterized protein BXZ73DRAFT_97255 [Epithele typhae]|uniref:uncharacterized protein n=1 Tax=Epithele typhae TaxID=378194 RepID=UPI002008B4BE|nr:uncharacterized protein BXZ73DRAFT_97255 [Epithele typhae]KAH9943202.1 hypothetical protein BXZ73DRAFT_97255 [Epithele typhae]
MEETQYVNAKAARASYRPNNLMSPGLKRAREPFRLRNALTGLLLTGFAVGVYAYSMSAVKQDVFDDVDEEARVLLAGSRAQDAAGGEGSAVAAAAPKETPSSPKSIPSPPAIVGKKRGVLYAWLGDRHPRILDPSTGSFLWGAPPVDNIGWLGERRGE